MQSCNIYTARSFAFPQLHCDGICRAMFKTNCIRDTYTRYFTLHRISFHSKHIPVPFQTGTCIRFPFLYFRNWVKASIHRMIKIGYFTESEFYGIISFLTLSFIGNPDKISITNFAYRSKTDFPLFRRTAADIACPQIFITSISQQPYSQCIVQHISCCRIGFMGYPAHILIIIKAPKSRRLVGSSYGCTN